MIDYLMSKAIKLMKKRVVDKDKNIQYVTVLRNGIEYAVDCGPNQMDHKEFSTLLYYAVKFLAEKLELSVRDTVFFLIPFFEHVETGRDLEEIADEYTANYVADITDREKIDA